MHILLLSATELEIKPTLQFRESPGFDINGHRLDVLIGGIGMLATSYSLLKSIRDHRPSYVIQAGIAGSFVEQLVPGKVVMVNEELIGDLGVTENGAFLDIFDMKLADANHSPFQDKLLVNPHWHEWKQFDIPFVRSVTVNTITTGTEKINELKEKYKPSIESMEGAALHYVGLQEKIPFIQLRSISNYVGERDKSKWKMKEAIDQLNNSLIQLIRNLP